MGIIIDDLDAVAGADGSEVMPAMRSGATVKLSVDQIATFITALLVDSAPATLDTLNELAAALGDDPNFATTVTNALAAKASLTGAETLTNKTLTSPVINSPQGAFLRGHIRGLTLSNDAGDLTNDISVATGEVSSRAPTPVLIGLGSSLIKRLDANWAAGTNQGMRYSGEPIANKTYHIFLGMKSDGTGADIYAYPGTAGTDADSLAFAATVLAAWQAETGASAYAHVGRIGSIVREGGAIVPFYQVGDTFRRKSPLLISSTTSTVADQLVSAGVPLGIVCAPIISVDVFINSVSTYQAGAGSALSGASDAKIAFFGGGGASAGRYMTLAPPIFFTNTSGQIYLERTVLGGSVSVADYASRGWIDTRGRG